MFPRLSFVVYHFLQTLRISELEKSSKSAGRQPDWREIVHQIPSSGSDSTLEREPTRADSACLAAKLWGQATGQRVTLSPRPCFCSMASSPPRVGGLEGSVLPAPEPALRLRPSPPQPRTSHGAANAAPGSSLRVCPSSEQAERNNRRRETKQHGQLGSA